MLYQVFRSPIFSSLNLPDLIFRPVFRHYRSDNIPAAPRAPLREKIVRLQRARAQRQKWNEEYSKMTPAEQLEVRRAVLVRKQRERFQARIDRSEERWRRRERKRRPYNLALQAKRMDKKNAQRAAPKGRKNNVQRTTGRALIIAVWAKKLFA